MGARTQLILLNGNFHTLKGWHFCTSGLSLETVILPVDESPGSLERAKATGYSLHGLVGKINLVFLCSAHLVLLWSGAVITGGNNSTGFPISNSVNTKFTSKDNILTAPQWLKGIWLSLGACFPKNEVTLKEGAASGPAAIAFLGHPGGPCSGLQRAGGEKPEVRGCVVLGKALDKPWSPSGLGRRRTGYRKKCCQ